MRTIEEAAEAEWREALAELRQREKALTRLSDELAADRRLLPGVPVTKRYRFEGPEGVVGFDALFAGRRQLIVYHHMLRPADPSPCSGCCMVADQFPNLSHVRARDTELVLVSRAPLRDIHSLQRRLGWSYRWYSTVDGFNADHDVTDGFGLNVFFRNDAGRIFRTYFTTGRGVETLGTAWTLLDLTPLGRQETWEDSPRGTPQTPPYGWWRLHDEYADEPATSVAATADGSSRHEVVCACDPNT